MVSSETAWAGCDANAWKSGFMSLSQPCAVSCRRAIHLRVGSRSIFFGGSIAHMAPADAVCPGLRVATVSGCRALRSTADGSPR